MLYVIQRYLPVWWVRCSLFGIALWIAVGANSSGAEIRHAIWTLTIRPGLNGGVCTGGGRANYWIGVRNPVNWIAWCACRL